LTTKYLFGGTTDVSDDETLENQIEEWIGELGKVEHQDIEIRLFQTMIDGFIFGLVPNEEFKSITSQSNSFQEPWNGEYYI
jgi:hypothetical protein